jgi:DNA-directed RNA polymerase sigma subunit (sigma70/sigma32)
MTQWNEKVVKSLINDVKGWRMRYALNKRFFEQETLAEVSKRVRISREKIRQAELGVIHQYRRLDIF